MTAVAFNYVFGIHTAYPQLPDKEQDSHDTLLQVSPLLERMLPIIVEEITPISMCETPICR